MRQYEVYDNPSEPFRDIAPFVAVLQSHFLERLPSTVVAPLLRPELAERFVYLSVDVQVAGQSFVLSLHELATVDARVLKHSIDNLADHQDAIERGLQRLFSGF